MQLKQGDKKMDESVLTALMVILSAALGYLLARYRSILGHKREQRLAAAAFRFELQSNLGWLDEIIETRNYLRDEAWVKMKNEGLVSYLNSPIPMKIIDTYDEVHKLNEQIRVLKTSSNERETEVAKRKAIFIRDNLKKKLQNLTDVIDKSYPKIGKNFK